MSINLYVQQLKEDLRTAAKQSLENTPLAPSEIDQDMEEHFASVENYLFGKKTPLAEIVGVEKVCFPPEDRLTDEQKAELAVEMVKLLELHNFYPDFPRGLPDHYKYEVLRLKWGKKYVKLLGGQSHLEFCDYEPKNCPFPMKHCACRRIELRTKKNKSTT